MARSGLDLGAPNGALSSAQISEHKESTSPSYINDDDGDDGGVQVTCFSEVVNETTFHLQIIRLLKQEKLSMRSKVFCKRSCLNFGLSVCNLASCLRSRSILQTASITCLGTQLATISATSIFLVKHQNQSSHGLKRRERLIQGHDIALTHQT
ncbi:hypothetical protein ACFX1X_012265 [Malus domestica]